MEDTNKVYKVVVCGPPNVGKSSFIEQLVSHTYNPNINPTISATTCRFQIELKGKKELFEIWDTSGNEAFRGLNQIFYKNSDIAIMMYNASYPETIKELIDFHKQILQVAHKNMVFGVVGNKSDTLTEEESVIQEREGKLFADSIKALFTLSSVIKNINIDSFFYNLVFKMMELNEQNNNSNSDNITLQNKTSKTGQGKKCC